MKHVLFDLDGTLLNSQLGIFRCFTHALSALGLPPITPDQLGPLVGPPLETSFAELLQTDDAEQVARGVEAYRARYREVGLFEAEIYPGISELLETLRQEPRRLHIATTKPEPFAKRIAAHFSIEHHFASVNGTTFDKIRHDKFDVMRYVVAEHNVPPDESVMIGDRKHDILAAQEHGMPTIAVLWGFGDEEELRACNPDYLVSTPAEVGDIIGAP